MGLPAAIVGAAALQGGASILGSAMQYQNQKNLMRRQLHWNTVGLVQKLKEAGLNPMLALGRAGHISGTGLGQAGMPLQDLDLAGTALQFSQAKKAQAETRTETERTGLVVSQRMETLSKEMRNYSEAGKLDAEADKAWSQSNLNNSMWKKTKAEITNLKQQLKNLQAQEDQTQADVQRLEKLADEIKAKEKNWKAQTSKIAVELVRLTRMKDIREHQQLLYYIETTLEALRMHSAAIFTPTKGD